MLALVFGRFVPGSSFLDLYFGRFLGVLILVPGRFPKRFIPGFSFLALLVVVLEVVGCARLLWIVAGELWPASCGWLVF